MKKLRLKRGQERRISQGCLWVFANQVDNPLRDYRPGELVRITDRSGELIGVGYVNPHSLIAARLLTHEDREIDSEFFMQRIQQAHHLRQKVLPEEEAVREVYSESDGLPGLIVDRYRDILVVQITTAGMERLKEQVVSSLADFYRPRAIFERSDASVRKLEGLGDSTGTLYGKLPPEPIWVIYSSLLVPADVHRGQKTGLYLDQRINLQFIEEICKGARVLDAFSYTGVWGLKAARMGAAEVVMLDESEWALELALAAARRDRLKNRCATIRGDAFDVLKEMAKRKESYDVVILDPPSFIRSKQHYQQGYKGYFDLNQKALAILKEGGFLVSCSCSHHMDQASFEQMLQKVMLANGRQSRILFRGGQGPDHPILPHMPETEYLHCMVLQVF
ncbi:MAG: class I SAM-dependent rRNA methyltransferase [Lentisphaerota bacterium]